MKEKHRAELITLLGVLSYIRTLFRKRTKSSDYTPMVIHRRVELRTPWLKVMCSTYWANGSYCLTRLNMISHSLWIVNIFRSNNFSFQKLFFPIIEKISASKSFINSKSSRKPKFLSGSRRIAGIIPDGIRPWEKPFCWTQTDSSNLLRNIRIWQTENSFRFLRGFLFPP